MKKLVIGFSIAAGILAAPAAFCVVRGYEMAQDGIGAKEALLSACAKGFEPAKPSEPQYGKAAHAVGRVAACLSALGALASTPQP